MDFSCLVCLRTAQEPLLCPNGEHLLCTACFLRVLETRDHVTCTKCWKAGDWEQLGIVTALCLAAPAECVCGALVDASESEEHKSSECGVVPQACPWCEVLVPREKIHSHRSQCDRNPALRPRQRGRPIEDEDEAPPSPKRQRLSPYYDFEFDDSD